VYQRGSLRSKDGTEPAAGQAISSRGGR